MHEQYYQNVRKTRCLTTDIELRFFATSGYNEHTRNFNVKFRLTVFISISTGSFKKLHEKHFAAKRILIRPPVYVSNGRTYKMLVMFLYFFFATRSRSSLDRSP